MGKWGRVFKKRKNEQFLLVVKGNVTKSEQLPQTNFEIDPGVWGTPFKLTAL